MHERDRRWDASRLRQYGQNFVIVEFTKWASFEENRGSKLSEWLYDHLWR
jgi:hypothetical protein